jgi:D-sedoheptulose 7-phosphate isomerase
MKDELYDLVIDALNEGNDLRQQLILQCARPMIQASIAIYRSIRQGGKLLLFGNGGSAADAQHIAAEFVSRFINDRDPLPAISLTTDTSALTAIGNDYGFEHLFSRQLQALYKPNDIVLAISTSGQSPNVLKGIKKARELSLPTIGLTGGSGGHLASLVDIPIVVPATKVARIQECHITIGHILTEVTERLIFSADDVTQIQGIRNDSILV